MATWPRVTGFNDDPNNATLFGLRGLRWLGLALAAFLATAADVDHPPNPDTSSDSAVDADADTTSIPVLRSGPLEGLESPCSLPKKPFALMGLFGGLVSTVMFRIPCRQSETASLVVGRADITAAKFSDFLTHFTFLQCGDFFCSFFFAPWTCCSRISSVSRTTIATINRPPRSIQIRKLRFGV